MLVRRMGIPSGLGRSLHPKFEGPYVIVAGLLFTTPNHRYITVLLDELIREFYIVDYTVVNHNL